MKRVVRDGIFSAVIGAMMSVYIYTLGVNSNKETAEITADEPAEDPEELSSDTQ